jgi:hypothetical protein
MTIWISLPTSVVPKAIAIQESQVVDAWYQRISSAFEPNPDIELTTDKIRLPRAPHLETEDLAASAIKKMFSDLGTERDKIGVEMLIDCRSSAAIGGAAPTYKLAAKAGLRKSLPFSLSGQAGTEVGQAINYLQNMQWDPTKVVVISAVQRVVSPDTRLHPPDSLPLGDAAAAICVASFPMPFTTKRFRILSVVSAQSGRITQSNFDEVFKHLIEKGEINPASVQWSILQSSHKEYTNYVQESLPKTTWLSRRSFRSVDFGCADILISLQHIFERTPAGLDGIGILWFLGKFGAIIAVAVDS